jgi:hypothetical protein
MLKASIIYIPGTGGSFLRRVLSLGKNMIVDLAYRKLDTDQKFNLFNNWNSHNWKMAEALYRPEYRSGAQNFFEFEKSPLFLIDAWHPTEFLSHDQGQQCWNTGAWPCLIFLHIKENQRSFIEVNCGTKNYSVDWVQEQKNYKILKQQYQTQSIELDFEDMCDKNLFLTAIEKIDLHLGLDLNKSMVSEMWQNWYKKSTQVWIK